MSKFLNPVDHVSKWYENNKNNWFLDIRGDDKALPEITKQIGDKNIDLFSSSAEWWFPFSPLMLVSFGSPLRG